jgi:hypothetical protein
VVKKFTLRETHSSIQKFPNLFIYFQICQGGGAKTKKKKKKKKTLDHGTVPNKTMEAICYYLPK